MLFIGADILIARAENGVKSPAKSEVVVPAISDAETQEDGGCMSDSKGKVCGCLLEAFTLKGLF